MSSQLPSALDDATIPAAPLAVVSKLRGAGHKAFLVGGCVRDLLRGARPKDYDVATSALPAQVQGLFAKTLPTGLEHGTITVRQSGENIEVTTFRTEGEYLDGRRPSQVHFKDDVVEDLSRRDFTINAMAFDPIARVLVDPFGGERDLSLRLVRCVRDPMERFTEDGLRTLRAVRFASVLDFALDASTEAAIPRTLHVFRKVAPERAQQELEKLLHSERAAWGVTLLDRTGLLAELFPELSPLKAGVARALSRTPPSLELRLAALFSASGGVDPEPALRRLKFSNRALDRVRLLVKERDLSPLLDAPAPALRRFLARLGTAPIEDLLAHALALSVSPDEEAAVKALGERLRAILAEKPPLTPRELALDGGKIMTALGVKPSPIVGEATRFLLDQVLEDPSLNSEDSLAEILRTWALARQG